MPTDSFSTFLRTLERLRVSSDEDDQGGVAVAEGGGGHVEAATTASVATIIAVLASTDAPVDVEEVRRAVDRPAAEFNAVLQTLVDNGIVALSGPEGRRTAQLAASVRQSLRR